MSSRIYDASMPLIAIFLLCLEQARIAYMSEDDLPELHMGLGHWVRNHLGLWGDNTALVAATGEDNADDASAAIVKAFWEQLRGELPKVH